MNYLLDSHILLWSIFQPEKLSENTKNIITDLHNKIYVSSITLWEITLKYQIVKLKVKDFDFKSIFEIIEEQDYEVLTLKSIDTKKLIKLPFVDNHKDPFDRMLISQAINYNLIIISKDNKFSDYKQYGLQLLN